MAITINGSGTITGITAGGLPDGCVDADTLAQTYLTPTGDGSGLSGIQVGVLQTKNAFLNGHPTFSGPAGWQDTGLSLDITPTDATTKMLIICNALAYHTSSGADNNWRMLCNNSQFNNNSSPDGNNTANAWCGNYRSSDVYDVLGQGAQRITFHALHDHNTTATLTYKLQVSTEASTLTLNRGYQTNNSRFGSPPIELVVVEYAV